jgi:hypothetical protein
MAISAKELIEELEDDLDEISDILADEWLNKDEKLEAIEEVLEVEDDRDVDEEE